MADPSPEVIDLESDMDEDEALRYAIALSLQEQDKPDVKDAEQPKPPSQGQVQPSGATFGSLALDRKKMEEERLKRLAKRRRQDDGDNDSVVEVPPPKRQATSEGPSSRPFTSQSPLPFPKGTVKRTWARGFPRTSDDIKIEEVFQKETLQLAVLSSFQWDDEWMISKLNMTRTKLMLVAFAADEAQVHQDS